MRRHLLAVGLAAALVAGSCTTRLYEGVSRAPERIATIHVGNTIVRMIDGQHRRGGAFDAAHFEVAPGTHRLTVVFELPARVVGVKTFPAQKGEGSCELMFGTEAGKQYYLGARPLGESMSKHWNGRWEAWVRDPSTNAADDIIARCTPESEAAVAAPPPAPPQAGAPAGSPTPPIAAAQPVPAAAASPGPSAPVESIRLGTWNLRSLGATPDKDYARIAVAIEQHFDILTVTEIVETPSGPTGYHRLLAALGDGWRGMVTRSPRPEHGADREYYAILYRRDRVRSCPGWDALRFGSDGPNGSASHSLAAFLREPAFGCFEAGNLTAPGVDFLLAVYRARTGDGDAAVVADEVAHLPDVFTAMLAARPGERDLIIAGDFNLEPVELAQVSSAADRTSGDGSRLNLLGARTPALTDHVLVFDPRATSEMLGDGEALDVRAVAESPADFYRTVSDHLPVMVRLRASGPDDD